MAYRVFETDQNGVDALTKDDLVNRQTLVIKDGKAWDIAGKVVLVDGADDALEQAEAIIKELGGAVSEKADEIKADLDAEGDGAAEGVGFLFG